jgi:hypothetical protein
VFVLQTLGGLLGHIWLNSTIYIHEMQCNRNENDDRGREREKSYLLQITPVPQQQQQRLVLNDDEVTCNLINDN